MIHLNEAKKQGYRKFTAQQKRMLIAVGKMIGPIELMQLFDKHKMIRVQYISRDGEAFYYNGDPICLTVVHESNVRAFNDDLRQLQIAIEACRRRIKTVVGVKT